MLAWTKNAQEPGGLALADVPDPTPRPDELLVRVDAFAPNPGDLAALPSLSDGAIPGWDGSGVVIEAAADGLGPQAGDRVVFLSLAARGWAERRAVPHTMTASAPHDVSPERLATLPVPATSALRAVRRLGSVLGRRMLIVGATGAVGRVAVQLAARSGAHVVAVARDERQHEELRRLGAHEVHGTTEAVEGRVHGAIDLIGGDELVRAYSLLAPGGTAIALGHAAGADEHFPYGAFVADPATADRSITSFFLGSEPGLPEEMAYLAADRDLDVGPLDIRPWTEVADWVASGGARTSGRPVFRIAHDD
ncbi:zinc-binding dehydrogenase [Microbacterium sp. LWO14-1.2]|uniref:zinc-binding dehydrogenase n=1 Tax=Microbacterium sp. LWO14-1.2 TaxID=3135263 RepID=UPI003138E329